MSARGFGSDNHSGIHPLLLEALVAANSGHAPSYGTDEISDRTQKLIEQTFSPQSRAFFVFNGTAANCLSLRALQQSFESTLVSDVSHLHNDECGAPEFFTGGKLIVTPSHDGKLRITDLEEHLIRGGDQHFSQVRVLSLTQPTEYGTVYSLEETRELISWAHKKNLYVHMDGARLANAAFYLNTSLRELTQDVDVISFGGTKNGMLGGEVVIVQNPKLSGSLKYLRKQMAQLPSKSRFIACQFERYLQNDLWRDIAEHSHKMAKSLHEQLLALPGVRVTRPCQSNAVFVELPAALVKKLREAYFFYVWNEKTFECRLMTSWDTQPEDIEGFVKKLKELL